MRAMAGERNKAVKKKKTKITKSYIFFKKVCVFLPAGTEKACILQLRAFSAGEGLINM